MQKTAQFDLRASDAAKGAALLLLLWHHLFYQHSEYGYWVYLSALMSKVCVAMFVLISGYGLAQSVQEKPTSLWNFYKRRFTRIYLGYWYLALIFVPIAIFVFGRTLPSVFETQPYLKFFIQMTGYHMYFKDIWYGYNPTWWFISLILGLYWLFPFLFSVIQRYGWVALIPPFLFLLPSENTHLVLPILQDHLFTFALGIFLSLNNGFGRISDYLKRAGGWRFLIVLAFVIATAILRKKMPVMNEIRMDPFFGLAIILFVFETTQAFKWLETGLAFLGQHLFNIFLFHTFLIFYFWPDFIYSIRQPLLIFLGVTVVCVMLSYLIERSKKWVGLDKLQAWLDKIPLGSQPIIE